MFLTLLRTSIRTICTPVYRGSQSARQIPPIVRCTRTLHSAACGVWQVGVVAKCSEADMGNILYMCIWCMNEESYFVRSHIIIIEPSNTGHELSFFVRNHRLLQSRSTSSRRLVYEYMCRLTGLVHYRKSRDEQQASPAAQ